MIAKLALLFTTVTLLELSILIPLGQAIGLFPTIALVLGTAILGASLAKRQGVTIWRRIQQELSSGQLPQDSLLDGLAVLIAGAFLLTPGVLSDIAGILLLLPPTRAPFKAIAKKYGQKMLESPDVHVHQQGRVETQPRGGGGPAGPNPFGGGPTRSQRDTDDDIIDVEPVESDRSSNSESQSPDPNDNHVDLITPD